MDMFKNLKTNTIKEVLYELENLRDYYTDIAKVKKFTEQNNDFEVVVGVGIMKAMERVYNILDKYK